ncbi:kinase-like domain-containing protein [Pterulicium gracile]|uniref:Kinase-like domain-containing protein n=1 Tax=Pterulicium gracile TaxID=1884261 RepID=A0A5C3QF77_9AGAR|nr:kinase-like domain-containing protein [Pterula gracilis]
MNSQLTTTNATIRDDTPTLNPTLPSPSTIFMEEESSSTTGHFSAPSTVTPKPTLRCADVASISFEPTPPLQGQPKASTAPRDQDLTGTLLNAAGCRLQLTGVIGQGGFGKVYSAKEVANPGLAIFQPPREFAVKTMAKSSSPKHVQLQAEEAAVHRHVSDHSNIVTLYEMCEDETYLFFIMEMLKDGDLHAWIREEETEEATLKSIMLQLIDALDYCHQSDLYHRDLKPANILLSRVGSEVKAHLADFGLATRKVVGREICGTPRYMGPEVYNSMTHGGEIDYTSSDVWSLGMVFCEMLTKTSLWDAAHGTDAKFEAFSEDPDYLYRYTHVSQQSNTMLTQMLEVDPELRITLPELKKLVQNTDVFFKPSGSELTLPPLASSVLLEEETMSQTATFRQITVQGNALK